MVRKVIDLTGQRFGKWTVMSEVKERNKSGQILWECQCDCGEVRNVIGKNLKNGKSNSCGCDKELSLEGRRYGNLTVLGRLERKSTSGCYIWECLCECGKISEVPGSSLRNGSIRGCGCFNRVDLIGRTFGKWKVIDRLNRLDNNNGSQIWKCLCECGNEGHIPTGKLTGGGSTNCGCVRLRNNARFLSNMTGEKHWNYNPEISDEQRMGNRYQLHGISMANWRKEIFNSDDYVCQGCGKRGYSLNAHHLNAWNAFPEQRFDTANGITLCSDCHKEYHHFNGYGDNTLEQFRDHIACIVGEEYVSEIEEALLSRESEIIGQEVEQKETRELQTT